MGAPGVRLAAVMLAITLAPVPATAEPARPWEDPSARDFDRDREEHSVFWERALRPRHDEYNELVANAERRLHARRPTPDSRAAAEAMLADAIALEPDSPRAYWVLGALQAQSERWQECAATREKIFELDPDYRPESQGSAWALDLGLAECFGLAGRYEKAIEHYQRILTTKHATGAYQVHWHLGEALMALGHLGEAIDALKTAAKLSRNREPLIHYALAVAYDRDEQIAESREQLSLAFARDPQLQSLARDDLTFTPPVDRWYTLGLAELGRPVARPEWALIYFRRFLAEHQQGPWARRASYHIEELGREERLIAERIGREGVAGIEMKKVAAAVARVEAPLQQCVAAIPDVLLQVRITVVVAKSTRSRRARSRTRRPARTGASPGVRTTIALAFDTPEEQITTAIQCVDAVADTIAMPPAVGVAGEYVNITFPLIARP